VFLVLLALVVDTGIWFTHKRQLQNRADSGALAAGVEYINQLKNCVTSPAATGLAIADVAKRYAGTDDSTITGTKYNQEIAKQSNLTVAVNATSPTAADNSDGGDPCTKHDPDSISPNGGYWTDVRVRESNIGTLFSGFGLDLPSISARARVEVKQLKGVRRGGLPFINEIGDYVPCVWAEFVRADDPGTRVSLVGTSNPVLLTADPNTPRRWTADVGGIQITSSTKDIGVVYWMGSKTGSACDFSTSQKGVLPAWNGSPAPIDRINVYEDDSPAANTAPMLHHFQLTPERVGPTRSASSTRPRRARSASRRRSTAARTRCPARSSSRAPGERRRTSVRRRRCPAPGRSTAES
jgi:hypothetical protein